ncbi:MAG: hypothetical protein Q7S87_14030 [Agitococcus sp.]|nr:hypothetical protein [Agitococcus sp.]
MINIINNILTSFGYQQANIEYSLDNLAMFLFIPASESNREEYFVTLQLNIQSDESAQTILEETAQELFESIRNSGKVERSFEKNCTMIICHEDAMISRNTILALEEDQYNFKKNVVTYAEHELHALKTHLSESGVEHLTNKIINEIINFGGGKRFLEFKNNHKNINDHYSLILKIALKLPFITYSPHEQQLTNLSLEIEQSFNHYQSVIFTQLMESGEWADENTHQQVERIWGNIE